MKDKRIANSMFDTNVRVERIINLSAMMWPADAFSSDIKDTIESDFEEILEVLNIRESIDPDASHDDINEVLIEKNIGGWLVQFATPVPNFDNGISKGYSFSWGMYTTWWMYGEDFDVLCTSAVEWRNEYIAKCRNKHEES